MLKYNEDFLWREYGIAKLANEDDLYYTPVTSVSAEEEYYEGEHDIKKVYLPKLKDGCIVSVLINYAKDTLDIRSFIEGEPGVPEGKIVLKNDAGWKRPRYIHYETSADLRYYTCHYIAEEIRKLGYKDILVEFPLAYNGEQVNNYVDSCLGGHSMLIVNIDQWEVNKYYVTAKYKGDLYYYSFTCDIYNEITYYDILPMDFDEDEEGIFTDEYLQIAEYLLDDVGTEFENILHFDILQE